MLESAVHTEWLHDEPSTVSDWVTQSPNELGIKTLEAISESAQNSERHDWPGDIEVLRRVINSDYFRTPDSWELTHVDSGQKERIGRITAAHGLRTGIINHELIIAIKRYLVNMDGEAKDFTQVSLQTDQYAFDRGWLHDTGKSQLAAVYPTLMSQITEFKENDRQLMYGHSEIGGAMLLDLDLPDPAKHVALSARKHHALHPSGYSNGHPVLSSAEISDPHFMQQIVTLSLSDTADATYRRPYMNLPDKQQFKFPAEGNALAIRHWAEKMIKFPDGVTTQTLRDFDLTIEAMASIILDESTLTHKLFKTRD